ncbi:PorT family protein [Rhodohalobacter sp. SW132]|uniref:porin family protein n=1 Tax=Rhodohalobacter sp. SW132 TaxID=2293433 RepID=UPI000E253C46|nr:porin family protein [Rhodohalobacter sp. SW132]REL38835.1 PorT family protein [Rhodohalobacter sp. SW132]
MMKKLTTAVLSIFVIVSFGLTHQVNAQSPIDFGVKGGLNFATLSSDDDVDSRSGFHAGLVLDFSLPMLPLGVESGLYYTQKGAEFTEEGITITGKLDYIEIPVLAKISVGPPGPFSPHIVAGPYAAYNINSELEASSGSASFSEDFSNETTDLDFGGIVGVGADFNFGITKLNVSARYSFGFSNINDTEFEVDDEKNRVFMISAGIMF